MTAGHSLKRFSVYAQRLKIVLTQCRKGNLAIRECGDLRAVRSMCSIAEGAIDQSFLDVSHILHAEQRQFSCRDLPPYFVFVHFILPALLGKLPVSREVSWRVHYRAQP